MPKAMENLADDAERELLAQLAIVRAMKPLTTTERQRVWNAIDHILQAENHVPGILDLIAKRGKNSRE